jgi:hypothetical protein
MAMQVAVVRCIENPNRMVLPRVMESLFASQFSFPRSHGHNQTCTGHWAVEGINE